VPLLCSVAPWSLSQQALHHGSLQQGPLWQYEECPQLQVWASLHRPAAADRLSWLLASPLKSHSTSVMNTLSVACMGRPVVPPAESRTPRRVLAPPPPAQCASASSQLAGLAQLRAMQLQLLPCQRLMPQARSSPLAGCVCELTSSVRLPGRQGADSSTALLLALPLQALPASQPAA
jgi:hypothetical protein